MAHAYLDERLPELAPGETHEVTGDEAEHAVKVARLRAGETIVLLNGAGRRVAGEVVEATKSKFSFRALAPSVEVSQPVLRITLVQALAKGGRDEAAVQMATELGAMGIVPWQAARSVARWQPDRADKHRARWQQIVREATKQSMRAWMPHVTGVRGTGEVAASTSDAVVLVLDPTAQQSLLEVPLPSAGECHLVVGPEGGITPEELAEFERAGAIRVKLGSGVLRTSTAGAAAISVLHTRKGSWDEDR